MTSATTAGSAESPPTAMAAFRLHAPGEAAVVQVGVPQPAPGQVLLQVAAVGLCGTDLEMLRDPARFGANALPITLGHEFAGRVVALGDGVTGPVPGAFALHFPMTGCGRCAACRRGQENICAAPPPIPGVLTDGGAAEYVAVPARSLVVGEELDPVQAAGMTDAGMTAVHAAGVGDPVVAAGDEVLVIGAGGVGHLLVQYLQAVTGARVTVLDRDPSACRFARGLGAEAALRLDVADVAERFAAVFDLVGTDETLAVARTVVRRGGRVVLVGTGGGVTPFGFFTVPRGSSLHVSSGGTRADLVTAVRLVRTGTWALSSTRFPLSDAGAALEALRAGRAGGRVVLTP